MIFFYRVLSTLIYPFLLIFILFRIILRKEDPVRYKEKIFTSHFKVRRKESLKLIWFHAASIGEFKSILPIIKAINEKNGNLEFLITTTTFSSSNLAKQELNKMTNVQHRFLPLDVFFLVEKFLLSWRPSLIFLVDSEIWPNIILKAKKMKIPLCIINARITKKTFNRWMIFPNTAKKIFGSFDLCLASNLETKNYLTLLSAKNIYFNGNIKLINNINENKIDNLNKEILKTKRFWLAASTHAGEENFCLKIHSKLKKEYKDLITIIAPRHINRGQSIRKLCKNLNLKAQILNKNETFLNDREVIIINSFGVLQNYFKYAKSVFIGKSLIKNLENDSGQNPIDAAQLGCKVYHGPYVHNFKEVYEILKKNNISYQIKDYEELTNNLIKDLKHIDKESNNISNLINNLGQKTLTGTMKSINSLLLNEI